VPPLAFSRTPLAVILGLALGVACKSDPGPDDNGSGEDSSGSTSETGDETETGETGEPMECSPRDPVVPTTAFFADVSDASGIRVDNYYEDPPDGTAINDHSRLAFADINGDGYDDIVMHSLFPNPQNGVPFEHLVFVNAGDGTFDDFSDESGLRDVQAGMFAFGDVDDDGDQDLFAGLDLQGYPGYESGIYLNDGDGRFERLENSGVENSTGTAANALFADVDGNGDLDLFVGHGGTTYAAPDRLYAGLGDGTFVDSTGALGGPPKSQPSNGSIACDYDDDGDIDIFVSTYSASTAHGHNHLWENDGGGGFSDVGIARGFAAQATGNYYLAQTGYGQDPEPDVAETAYKGSNGFGLDCGDVDNDGDLDVLLTAISHPVNSDYNRKWSDPSQVLANGGAESDFSFENQWLARGLPFNEGDVDGAWVDFDNDGRLDISISRDRKYEGNYTEPKHKAWFGLMRQLENGAYESLGIDSGINDPDEELYRMKSAQNHAWSDVDHDGDLDLLVGGRDQGGGRPNFLFRNDIGHENRWLAVRLVGDGDTINRDAIGARVILTHPDGQVVREKKSSRGMYNSEDTRVLHFGLGDVECDYTLEVRWPDGTSASFDPTEFGDDMYVVVTYPDQIEVE
jgi:hypothetical protein